MGDPSSACKLADIIRFTRRYDALPPSAKALVEGRLYQQVAVARFVLSANLSEETGLGDFDRSFHVLHQTPSSHHHPMSQAERETRQMGAAMEVLKVFYEELMEEELISRWEALILTPEIVQDVHRVMMHGILSNAGQMRSASAVTGLPDGKLHAYPPPEALSWQLLSVFDCYNLVLTRVSDDLTVAIPQLYRLTAELFVQFVGVHPFSDGNGRLARMLANHVLSAITPFPVTPHADGSSENRQLFLKAIRSSAQSSSSMDFAAMLIEAGWISWHVCFQSLERHGVMKTASLIKEIHMCVAGSKEEEEVSTQVEE